MDSTENSKDGGKMVLIMTMGLNLFFSAAFVFMV